MRRATVLCISALLLMEVSPLPPAFADEELGPRIKVFTEEQPPLQATAVDSTASGAKSESVAGAKTADTEKASDQDKSADPDKADNPSVSEKTDVADKKDADPTDEDNGKSDTASEGTKTLTGYIKVVPLGTKIPIIMDTAIESETSQESDEFTARTAEDLEVDGAVAIPAGSTIKGRISQINPPRHMNRTGSVALKFDTITTPDTRQVPIVANLVAHGGVIHAKRGLRDVTIDAATVTVPILLGLGIGYLAGNSNSSSTTTTTGTTSSGVTKGEAAMIGAGIGIVVGVAILCAKKGNKVDVRPGDELKIELAENLRMPTN